MPKTTCLWLKQASTYGALELFLPISSSKPTTTQLKAQFLLKESRHPTTGVHQIQNYRVA